MRETINAIRAGNRDLAPDQVDRLIDEAIAGARDAFRSTPRRRARRPLGCRHNHDIVRR